MRASALIPVGRPRCPVVRTAWLALLVIAGGGCRRGSLQRDADGAGIITADASADWIAGDGRPPPSLAPDAAPTADANCGRTDFSESVYPPDILVLLDQSVSGDRVKWSQLLTALTDVIAAKRSDITWGLYTFPEAGPACGPETAAPVIDVPVTYADYAAVASGIVASRTDGSGSPTAAAIDLGRRYLQSLPHTDPRLLLLVTDHAPSCAGTIGALSGDSAQAQADALAAITAAIDERIGTIVLAPSTTAPGDVPALNALAVAGASFRRDGNALVFQDETSFPLLFPPRPQHCAIPLSSPPPVPDVVAVTFNDQPVPRDTSHMTGWDYTDASHDTITFFGDWCLTLLDTQAWRVQAYYGCPN